MDKKYIFVFFALFVALVLTSGCIGGTKTQQVQKQTSFVGGTEGVKISLLPGQPPSQIFEVQPFLIGVQLENKGEGNLTTVPPLPSNIYGYVSIAGIDFSRFNTTQSPKQSQEITRPLPPTTKIINSVVPGGQDQITFEVKAPDIIGAQTQYPLEVSVLYRYTSIATAAACLKEDIYSQTVSGKEICKLVGTKPVESSGAPIKVTSIEELPTGFNIKIKNVGTGYPFKVDLTSVSASFPTTKSGIDQFSEKDRVAVTSVKLEEIDLTANCTPSELFLVNNEAQFFCRAELGKASAEAVKQLIITLDYGYVSSVSTTLNIQGTS
jgi:hypothetical protein